MKYYAVTEDPNELMHYGVKGMKWGQHIFGDKPRSPAFKKAATKLRASMKNGIKKTQANWKKTTIKRQANKDAKEAKLNAQADARLKEALGSQANRSAKHEQRAIRREIRRENAADRREERQMNRYLQKARHGTLKYKKLRDDQIQSVAERLNLENQARRLSGNETPHMLTRIKRSIGEGVVRGVGSAVEIGITEHAKAKARYKNEARYGAKTARLQSEAKRIRDQADRANALDRDELFFTRESKFQKKKDQEREKRELEVAKMYTRKKAEADVDKEYYKMLAETGGKADKSELRGRNAALNRQKRVAQYRETKFLDDARKDAVKDFAKRGKKETDEDYETRTKDIGSMFKYAAVNSEAAIKAKQPRSKIHIRRRETPIRDSMHDLFGVESMADERRRLQNDAKRRAEQDAAERERFRANARRAAELAERERERNRNIVKAREREEAYNSVIARYTANQNNSSYANLYPRSKVTWSSTRSANDETSRRRRARRGG